MRVKQLQLFENRKIPVYNPPPPTYWRDIFHQLRTIIHLCTIILQSIIIGVCDGHRGGVLVKQIERRGI